MQGLLEQLDRSIADNVLTTAEKHALATELKQRPLRVDQLHQLRNHAFTLVQQRARDPQSAGSMPAVVNWLAGVIKVLDQVHTQVAVRSEVWFSPGNACRDAVIRHLRGSRQAIDICVFTIADDRISDEILAAHRRGIAIRVISDNDKRDDLGSDIQRMADQGVKVALDRSDAHMHHKFALFDGAQLLNGSFNWTRSASQYNEENLVSTSDPVQVRHFAVQFETLWESLD
ncbi:MAG: phospholipase D-like domain-containing protein [Pseudomarimonas sp.]